MTLITRRVAIQKATAIGCGLAAAPVAMVSHSLPSQQSLSFTFEEMLELSCDQRAAILLPWQEAIDLLASTADDYVLKCGWGRHRRWVRVFIGDYILQHGFLPEGEHRVDVVRPRGLNYTGKTEIFPPIADALGCRATGYRNQKP